MKDLGKTIAKYRKEHKLNQSQLAKELENYDIYVKQNSISAWELGTATPNSRLCKKCGEWMFGHFDKSEL